MAQRHAAALLYRVVQEAERAHRLEELCELIIVLKKNCSPQVIECLLMFVPQRSFQKPETFFHCNSGTFRTLASNST